MDYRAIHNFKNLKSFKRFPKIGFLFGAEFENSLVDGV